MVFNWQPKNIKFKRLHKGRITKIEYRNSARQLFQGSFGLRILKSGRLSAKQLEQAKKKIISIRQKREKQKIWFNCLPDIPVTSKPLGVRMGKGKGTTDYWISRLTAGKMFLQINWMPSKKAKRGLYRASKVLPVPTKIVTNKIYKKPLKLKY